jgi:hypothetical protein
MTEQELRKKIGIGKNELVETNKGFIDIFGIGKIKDTVSYGFLATGVVQTESIDDFLAHFNLKK